MKKLISSLFVFVVLFVVIGFMSNVNASTATPKLFLDGKQLVSDVDPINNQGTTLVPLAVLSSGLGYNVNWEQELSRVTISNVNMKIQLTIGNKLGLVNDKSYELLQAPSLHKDRTMVPIRFISEVMGLEVNWKQDTAEVILTSPVKQPEATPAPTPTPEVVQDATIQSIKWDDENQLIIGYEGKLSSPKVMLLPADEKQASRLVVDFTNTDYTYDIKNQFISGQVTVGFEGFTTIGGYRYSLFNNNPLTARVVVELLEGTQYQMYSQNNEFTIAFYDSETEMPQLDPSIEQGNTQLPEVTPAPTDDPNRIYHIVLDPGHGDTDPGAVNKKYNYFEKDFNLSVALKMKTELEKNKRVKVHLTRNDDTFLELSARIDFAENIPDIGVKADLFISIHANSFKTDVPNGAETYYIREDSKEFAKAMHPYLVKGMGINDREVRTGNFKVIRETTMPAILIEAGYMSNEKDVVQLFNSDVQARLAKELANGVIDYLKL